MLCSTMKALPILAALKGYNSKYALFGLDLGNLLGVYYCR